MSLNEKNHTFSLIMEFFFLILHFISKSELWDARLNIVKPENSKDGAICPECLPVMAVKLPWP